MWSLYDNLCSALMLDDRLNIDQSKCSKLFAWKCGRFMDARVLNRVRGGAKPSGIHSHLHQADTKHFQHKIGFDYSEIRLNFDLFRNEIEYYGTNHG